MRVVFEEPKAIHPVVVARFADAVEASMARGVLAGEGIESELRDDALVGLASHLSIAVGGVKLVVSPADEPRALMVLATLAAKSAAPEAPEADSDRAVLQSRWYLRSLFALVLLAIAAAALLR